MVRHCCWSSEHRREARQEESGVRVLSFEPWTRRSVSSQLIDDKCLLERRSNGKRWRILVYLIDHRQWYRRDPWRESLPHLQSIHPSFTDHIRRRISAGRLDLTKNSRALSPRRTPIVFDDGSGKILVQLTGEIALNWAALLEISFVFTSFLSTNSPIT